MNAYMQAVQCNATQRVERLLLTDLWLLQIEGVPGIQQSGGRRAAGEVAEVRVLQLPATKQRKKKRETMFPFTTRAQETVETERRKERSGRGDGPEPVGDLALLLVGLDEHARVAHEVRVALAQDDPHRLGVDEADEAEHALLLVRDAHVLHRPVHAAKGGRGRRTGRVAVDGSVTRFGSFRSPVIWTGVEWNGTDWTTRREGEERQLSKQKQDPQ
jgi:hypothetical protein